MDARELKSAAAIDTLRELLRHGYTLTPRTRIEVNDHKMGAHSITYADRILISGGPGLLDDALRELVRRQQPYLLAAACILEPPTEWLEFLVGRCRAGRLPLRT